MILFWLHSFVYLSACQFVFTITQKVLNTSLPKLAYGSVLTNGNFEIDPDHTYTQKNAEFKQSRFKCVFVCTCNVGILSCVGRDLGSRSAS